MVQRAIIVTRKTRVKTDNIYKFTQHSNMLRHHGSYYWLEQKARRRRTCTVKYTEGQCFWVQYVPRILHFSSIGPITGPHTETTSIHTDTFTLTHSHWLSKFKLNPDLVPKTNPHERETMYVQKSYVMVFICLYIYMCVYMHAKLYIFKNILFIYIYTQKITKHFEFNWLG